MARAESEGERSPGRSGCSSALTPQVFQRAPPQLPTLIPAAPIATPAPSPTAEESSTSPTGRPGSFVREPALCLGVQLPQGSLRAL